MGNRLVLRIAVYAIAKDEAKHAERFMASCEEADGVFVLDTGSTDDTVAKLTELGAVVSTQAFDPFDFGKAKNAALAMVPDDFPIRLCLDLDEVLEPGWSRLIRKAWGGKANRLDYREDCGTGVVPKHNIHGPGFHWKYPIHEALYPDEGVDVVNRPVEITVLHKPDDGKPRDYLVLMAQAAKDMPDDPRMAFYHARELHYKKQHEAAVAEFLRYLDLAEANWAAERAQAMRFMAAALAEIRRDAQAEAWYLRACGEVPESRDAWLDLGRFYLARNKFPGAYFAAHRALDVQTSTEPFGNASSWREAPHDILSVAAWYLSLKEEARKQANIAITRAPWDARVQRNHAMIEGVQ